MKHRSSDFSGLISEKRSSFTKGKMICGEKYMVNHKLGQGTFGQVYIGVKVDDQGIDREVAIKIETEVNSKNPQLINECQYLRNITERKQKIEGFPKVFASGVENGYSYLVMELLGPNLQDLLSICGGSFSLKTTILLGLQILQRMQWIHSKGYIYRDVKPENFIMGIGDNSHLLYVVDFGLAKKYLDQITQLHYPYRQDRTLTGTVRYTSISSHLGIQQSRRDDLEAVCYMLIYFLKGKLPWQGMKGDARIEREQIVMESKLKVSTKQLCEGLPYQIANIVNYCKDLSYYDAPDYSFIISQLNTLYVRQGYVLNYSYDWVAITEKTTHKSPFLDFKIGNEQERIQSSNSNSFQSKDQIEEEFDNNNKENDEIIEF